MTNTNMIKERDLMELVDAYVEARHIGGCHTYNAKTADARAKVVASLQFLGFTAADMATASAQGFRDGVASVAANAGSEPVARADSWTNDQWIDLAQRHANADWNSDNPDGYLNAVKALCNDFAAAHPSPPEGMVGGWIAIPGALPEPGVPVLLDIGKKYPIRAMWAAKHTVQAADDDTDWGEYVEEDDMYYAPEGWYEWNEHEDTNWAVSATPRAWAPLPPTTSAGSGKGE